MLACRHMSAHVGTYQHMSACPNVLTYGSMQNKFQMVGIRDAANGFTCWHLPAHVGTLMLYVRICWHMPAHDGGYQDISACSNLLTYASMQDKFQMVCIRGSESGFKCWHVGRCQHMSAHISTCRHVQMC